jgi:hypothetical protein
MRRHHLARDAAARSVTDAARGMLVLHASDPASVYLSALARCPGASLADVSAALYDDRTLVKMLGMRRTMFVVPSDWAPVVHSAASLSVAAGLRRQLVKALETRPTEPAIGTDVAAWLAEVEDGVEKALAARGEAFGAQLATDEPRLRTAFLPTTDKAWDVKVNLTTRVLTLMAAEGRLVRGRPRGSLFSRQHSWAPDLPEPEARAALAGRWLEVFGPTTVADLKWWTGWSLGSTRKALAAVDTVAVDLDGVEGIVRADDIDADPPVEPTAALLPALDPTPMGWQQRDWYLGSHREMLFDRNGNIGPTVWWDGRVVGGWAVHRDGEIVWSLLEDVGREAIAAVGAVAADLQDRLESNAVVPSFRTPLETELTA